MSNSESEIITNKEFNKHSELENNEKTIKCCLCGNNCENKYGNNPWPLANGRCCNVCNDNLVIPARIKLMKEGN